MAKKKRLRKSSLLLLPLSLPWLKLLKTLPKTLLPQQLALQRSQLMLPKTQPLLLRPLPVPLLTLPKALQPLPLTLPNLPLMMLPRKLLKPLLPRPRSLN